MPYHGFKKYEYEWRHQNLHCASTRCPQNDLKGVI